MITLIELLLVYLVGVAVCYAIIVRWLTKECNDWDHYSDMLRVYFVCLYSWVGLLVFLIVVRLKRIFYDE